MSFSNNSIYPEDMNNLTRQDIITGDWIAPFTIRLMPDDPNISNRGVWLKGREAVEACIITTGIALTTKNKTISFEKLMRATSILLTKMEEIEEREIKNDLIMESMRLCMPRKYEEGGNNSIKIQAFNIFLDLAKHPANLRRQIISRAKTAISIYSCYMPSETV